VSTLLAVDAGIRAGLASYGGDGRLRWYRSRNYGSRSRLRKAARGLLRETPDLSMVVVEGGGPPADAWLREAERAGVEARRVDARVWRERLLLPRDRRSGVVAKEQADRLARRVIDWSGAPRPTSLRHDAAEAILVGLWGVLETGWLTGLPRELEA
jgi:hypothetical protein